MKHFINLQDIPAKDLRKILIDAKRRKALRKRLNNLDVDPGSPLKGNLLIQMFEKSSLRTRLSFYLAIKQLGGSTLTLRPDELHLAKGGESIADTAKILSNFGNAFMLRTDNEIKLGWNSYKDLAKPSRGRGASAGPIDPNNTYWKKRKLVKTNNEDVTQGLIYNTIYGSRFYK